MTSKSFEYCVCPNFLYKDGKCAVCGNWIDDPKEYSKSKRNKFEVRSIVDGDCECLAPAIDLDGVCKSCLRKVALIEPAVFFREAREVSSPKEIKEKDIGVSHQLKGWMERKVVIRFPILLGGLVVALVAFVFLFAGNFGGDSTGSSNSAGKNNSTGKSSNRNTPTSLSKTVVIPNFVGMSVDLLQKNRNKFPGIVIFIDGPSCNLSDLLSGTAIIVSQSKEPLAVRPSPVHVMVRTNC